MNGGLLLLVFLVEFLVRLVGLHFEGFAGLGEGDGLSSIKVDDL